MLYKKRNIKSIIQFIFNLFWVWGPNGGWLLLNVVVWQWDFVFKLLSSENESLVIWGFPPCLRSLPWQFRCNLRVQRREWWFSSEFLTKICIYLFLITIKEAVLQNFKKPTFWWILLGVYYPSDLIGHRPKNRFVYYWNEKLAKT